MAWQETHNPYWEEPGSSPARSPEQQEELTANQAGKGKGEGKGKGKGDDGGKGCKYGGNSGGKHWASECPQNSLKRNGGRGGTGGEQGRHMEEVKLCCLRGCECAGRGRRVVRERLRRLRFGPSAWPPISLHRSSQPRTSLWCRSRPPTSQWPHRRPPTSQWPHRRPRTSQWRHRRPPTSQSTPRHRRLRDQPTSATRHPPSRPSPHCLQAPLLFATHTYGPTRAPVRAWAVHTATGQVGAAGVRRSRACRETMPALNSDGLVARACTACARARLSAD